MLCYKCGSHVPEGRKSCSSCGQTLAQASGGSASSASSVVSQRRSQRSASRGGLSVLANGDVLSGRYRIIQPIGGGGAGAVYRTHDQDIDVDVALKTVAPKLLQTPDEKKNFSRKIRLARKLHHANIVRIYDDGYDGELRFFTMQLLEGLTLRKVIDLRREKHQPFVSQEIEPIFRQLVAALEYAHRSTYHGDLKPDNIIILPDVLKLTDFCLIQALPLKPFLAIQKSRGRPFSYIAPEIKLEASSIDGRADIFSLGVILLEMLTGEVFSGRWDRETNKLCEALPKKVDALIRRALSDHADARFQAVDDFMDSLEEVLSDGELDEIPAAAAGPPPPPLPPDDDAEISDPELISGSSVMLIDGDTDPGATASHRLGSAGDHTPLERPPALGADEDEPLLGPPPLPPEDDDVDTAIERQDSSAPSTLAEEVRRVTGESSDVYHRRTEIESEHHAMPPAPAPGGNGAGGGVLPSPPPLPADAAEGFAAEEETAGEIDEPLGIHDELTALSPYPEPPPGSRAGPLPTPMPTIIPPPLAPVLPPRRRRSKAPLLVGGLAAFVVLLGAGLWLNSYITRLKHQINEQRVSQFTTPTDPAGALAAHSADAGRPHDAAADLAPDAALARAVHEADASTAADEAAAAEKKRIEDEQRRQQEERQRLELAQQQQEAERVAEEQRRQQEQARLAALKRQRAEEQQAAQLMREQADRAAADKRKRDRERKAEARRVAEQERQRQREEARRIAEETRRRKEEQRRQGAEEKARAQAEREAREKEREKARRETKVAAAGPDSRGKCPRGMARVEAGSFKMGSAPNDPMRNFEEKRLSKVDVATFCIDYYEYPNGKRVLPRTSVSWYQAKSLCEAKGKRLCSEEEWEKACKGPKSLRYPYGNRFRQGVCNTEDEDGNDRELALPKNFARCRSAYGPINLSGNAAEWTASKFSAGLSDRVHKGGAANRPDWAARCANRGNLAPNEKNPMLGFRCCADPL